MVEFIYMTNVNTGGSQWFPDLPGIKERFEPLGWEQKDPPPEKPFVSQHHDVIDGTGAWVRLYHPLVKAFHDYPNNAAALEGAYEAGWELPKEPDEEAESSEAPKKSRKSTPSAKAESKEEEQSK